MLVVKYLDYFNNTSIAFICEIIPLEENVPFLNYAFKNFVFAL